MNEFIKNACEQLLKEYCEHPLWFLREGNIQSRLNQLILAQYETPSGGDTVPIEIKSTTGKGTINGEAKRSQMELKLTKNGIGVGEKKKNERSDIVVLKSGAVVSCAPSGPLDITAGIEVEYVDAVIEVKAAPSNRWDIRNALKSDINKLLSVKGNGAHVEAHFLFLDKSLPMPGCEGLIGMKPNSKWENNFRFEKELSGDAASVVYMWDLNPDLSSEGKRCSRLRHARVGVAVI